MAQTTDNLSMSTVTNIPTTSEALVIRTAGSEDADVLRRLALLDDQRPLNGQVLVAEVDGETLAAYGIESGRAIADPFRRTASLVAMLEQRATPAGRRASRRMVRGPSGLDRARHDIAA